MRSHNRLGDKAVPLILAIILATVTRIGTAAVSVPAVAQQNVGPNPDDLGAGRNFLETKVYTEQQDQEVLTRFDGLRVADVSDGMDKVGLANVGLMSHEIHPVWKDTKTYRHRFIGIAEYARHILEGDKEGRQGFRESDGRRAWTGLYITTPGCAWGSQLAHASSKSISALLSAYSPHYIRSMGSGLSSRRIGSRIMPNASIVVAPRRNTPSSPKITGAALILSRYSK